MATAAAFVAARPPPRGAPPAARAAVVCKARPAGGRAKRPAGGGRAKRRAGTAAAAGTPPPADAAAAPAAAAPDAAAAASAAAAAAAAAAMGASEAAGRPGESVESTLARDLAGFRTRQRRREGKDAAAADEPETESTLARVGKTVNTLLVADFFVVCFFLAWLVVALVPHFAYHNEVLLDAWLSLWTLVIQPLLGVLMLGTIVAGTLSYVQSKEEITTM